MYRYTNVWLYGSLMTSCRHSFVLDFFENHSDTVRRYFPDAFLVNPEEVIIEQIIVGEDAG